MTPQLTKELKGLEKTIKVTLKSKERILKSLGNFEVRDLDNETKDKISLVENRMQQNAERSEILAKQIEDLTQFAVVAVANKKEENRIEVEKKKELRKYLQGRIKSASKSIPNLTKSGQGYKSDAKLSTENLVKDEEEHEASDDDDWEISAEQVPNYLQDEVDVKVSLVGVPAEVKAILMQVIEYLK